MTPEAATEDDLSLILKGRRQSHTGQGCHDRKGLRRRRANRIDRHFAVAAGA